MDGFPGITVSANDEALFVRSQQPLSTLASSVVGGGFQQIHTIINRHVSRFYDHPDPVADLIAFAAAHDVHEQFVGLMTARYIRQARTAVLQDGDLTVAAIITAGLGNVTCAGLSAPAVLYPGTINMIVLTNVALTPSAMINAVITATEVKTHVLLDRELRTPDGLPATGTSTDAIVIAHPGGAALPYAGPATPIGALIGRTVRAAFVAAIDAPST